MYEMCVILIYSYNLKQRKCSLKILVSSDMKLIGLWICVGGSEYRQWETCVFACLL